MKDTHIAAPAAEWTCEAAIKRMQGDDRREIRIISFYYQIKKFRYKSSAQLREAIGRDIKAAIKLKTYEIERIGETLLWLKNNADFKWTLESVHKHIDEDLAVIGRAPQVVKI